MLHFLGCWESRLDEVIGDLVVFFPVQQNAVGIFDCSPGSPHLLIVVYDGARSLEVDDESKVGLIKTHSESDRSD